jgi:sugar/nucleoside kinase (ribokinase family)
MRMSTDKAFIQDLEKANIAYKGVIKQNDLPTGCCNILVSPDGERTMATHIGIGSQLHPDELTEDSLQGIDHIYMESYLWDHDLTKQTLKKVGKIAKTMNIETSLSLSDPFCVDRHRDELKEFIEEYVDLVFCNFDEAKMFAQSETMADVSAFFQSFGKKIAMTASAEGAYFFMEKQSLINQLKKLNKSLIQRGQVIISLLAFSINIYQTKQLMRL